MTTKFQFPISLPRWTKAEFDAKREKYTAEHGYEIHIPGFEDIFHYNLDREPSAEELAQYKAKDVDALGERRFEQIRALMAKKRERFVRLLSSPTPRIVMNAASALTFIDDINDTLGTVGVLARTAAHVLPGTAGKLMAGPAGWAFLGADITNLAMSLCRMPWKAKRLQHDLHAALMLNPISRKTRLRRLNKLKRLSLTKGEVIEGLQTTDNMFGIGLCLGPIMGLLYDIPFGMYRAFQGREVRVSGLPAPCYAVDRVVGKAMSSAAQIFYGKDDFNDDEKSRTMLGFNYLTQWQKAHVGDQSPLDFIDDPSGIEIPAPRPENPSTIDVVESEVGNIEEYVGWPATGTKWMSTNEMIDHHTEEIIDDIHAWEDRNKDDVVANVSAQNMSEAGMNSVALLEGDDAVDWDFNAVGSAYLKVLNGGLRLPIDASKEQLACLTEQLEAYDAAGQEVDGAEAVFIAKHMCDLTFTTTVPERGGPDEEYLLPVAVGGIERLKKWFAKKAALYAFLQSHAIDVNLWGDARAAAYSLQRYVNWLRKYGGFEYSHEYLLRVYDGYSSRILDRALSYLK